MYTASKISLGEELKIENTVDSLSRTSKYSPDKNRYSGLYNLNRYEPKLGVSVNTQRYK